jgi:hypothetical protein
MHLGYLFAKCLCVQVTRRLAILLDTEVDCNILYDSLMKLLRTYSTNQMQKYSTNCVVEEESASDLALLIQMLSNILSKDLMIFSATSGMCESLFLSIF